MALLVVQVASSVLFALLVYNVAIPIVPVYDVVRPVHFFFFSSRRRHTRSLRDWSSDVCSSDLGPVPAGEGPPWRPRPGGGARAHLGPRQDRDRPGQGSARDPRRACGRRGRGTHRQGDAERLFRVDRIRSARPTGEHFEPRGLHGAGRPLYTRSERDRPVRLRLGPAARWVVEYYETEHVQTLGGGWI